MCIREDRAEAQVREWGAGQPSGSLSLGLPDVSGMQACALQTLTERRLLLRRLLLAHPACPALPTTRWRGVRPEEVQLDHQGIRRRDSEL